MPDWTKYAIDQANRARRIAQIHRSVAETTVPDYGHGVDFDWHGFGIRVFFGSDGFLQNAKVREEVTVLQRLLTLKGIEELGFGIDTAKEKPGVSWALIVRSEEDTYSLGQILNAAHAVAFFGDCDMAELRRFARQCLEDLDIDPDEFLGFQS